MMWHRVNLHIGSSLGLWPSVLFWLTLMDLLVCSDSVLPVYIAGQRVSGSLWALLAIQF